MKTEVPARCGFNNHLFVGSGGFGKDMSFNLANILVFGAGTGHSMLQATLSGLEGLLQDVDTAKSRLAMLHRQLEGKLHKAEDLAAKKRQAKVRTLVLKTYLHFVKKKPYRLYRC